MNRIRNKIINIYFYIILVQSDPFWVIFFKTKTGTENGKNPF